MCERVTQQVRKNLHQPSPVGYDDDILRTIDTDCWRRDRKTANCFVQDRLRFNRLQCDIEPSRFSARRGEEVLQQAIQPTAAADEHLEEMVAKVGSK